MSDLNEELLNETVHEALNHLCKWRSVFAGWQLGTRTNSDGESRAVRDHREVTMLMRVELQALTSLLISKGVLSRKEWLQALVDEAGIYEKGLEERFPGFKATDAGITMQLPEAGETMKKYNFPP